MGIYYFAVDYGNKLQMWPPKGFPIKSPGVFNPDNPFPNMILMKNMQGNEFVITSDMCTTYEHEFDDVTEEVYNELKEQYSEYDYDLAKWNDE